VALLCFRKDRLLASLLFIVSPYSSWKLLDRFQCAIVRSDIAEGRVSPELTSIAELCASISFVSTGVESNAVPADWGNGIHFDQYCSYR
jgi:hypothetical protein